MSTHPRLVQHDCVAHVRYSHVLMCYVYWFFFHFFKISSLHYVGKLGVGPVWSQRINPYPHLLHSATHHQKLWSYTNNSRVWGLVLRNMFTHMGPLCRSLVLGRKLLIMCSHEQCAHSISILEKEEIIREKGLGTCIIPWAALWGSMRRHCHPTTRVSSNEDEVCMNVYVLVHTLQSIAVHVPVHGWVLLEPSYS